MERTAGILREIVANKRLEVERQKKAVSLQTLLAMGSERFDRPVLSMRKALAASPSGIIAEFKRKSPSKGWLFPDAKVEDIVPAYSKAGAAACSILTDEKFFGGSFRDLQSARKQVNIPLLRKDFIIDEYQLFQSRALGADAVLLIAAALTESDCLSLAETAHSLDLEVLLEIHSEAELSYLNPHIDMLGINNRRLDTFHTDVATSFRLAEQIQGVRGTGYGVQGGENTPEGVRGTGYGEKEKTLSLPHNNQNLYNDGKEPHTTEEDSHQIIQTTDRLAGSNNVSGNDLSGNPNLSGSGNLRLNQSDTPGGSIHSRKYSGRIRTAEQSGVSELPVDSPRLPDRTGNAFVNSAPNRVSEQSNLGKYSETTRLGGTSFNRNTQSPENIGYPVPCTPYPVPRTPLMISESGLSDADTVKRLRQCGFQGFLIGESFMTTPAPGESLSHLLKRLL
jgi:indole-3-glycerol phosphate synthase